MILMIDNYDSFTYNLVQYLEELGEEVRVFRNDAIDIDQIKELDPEAVIISPGPGGPLDSGISLDCIRDFAGIKPILGVCLGHQSIAYAFGGKVIINHRLMHGKVSQIFHDGKTLYQGLSQPFTATRYHSLIVAEESLPDCLEVTSRSETGEIMGIRHKQHMVEGVQFHPESILTSEGKNLLANFIALSKAI